MEVVEELLCKLHSDPREFHPQAGFIRHEKHPHVIVERQMVDVLQNSS